MTTGIKVREVFGQNLRKLADQQPESTSQICRDLGVNRTQFNRYLNGTAFPRPDTLDKICRRFGRDARIFTMPLEEIDRISAGFVPHIDIGAFSDIARGFDHNRMPDGAYLLMAPQMGDRTRIVRTLVRLRTLESGVAVVDWAVPSYFAKMIGRPTSWRERRATGLAFQHVDGISFLMAHKYTRTMRVFYFSFGYDEMDDLHARVVLTTMRQPGGGLPAQPTMLERVPATCRDIISARRKCGDVSLGEAPKVYQTYAKRIMAI